MTNTRTIEITVSPEGGASVRTKGFAGPACRDASRFVERALGEAVADRPTAEFYRAEEAEQRVGQG